MRRLIDAMAADFEQIAGYLEGGNPAEQHSYAVRAEYLMQQAFSRSELATELGVYHEKLGAGPVTMANIELLREAHTLTVVTGQQAGYLTGPLYTLYKAITAVKLAHKQSQALGCPVVPVFWIAGEDHDWQEIQEACFLNREGILQCSRLPGEGGGLSVGRLPVPGWEFIRTELEEILPSGEFSLALLQEIEKLTRQAENLSEWFALILQYLIGDQGLIFFDPLCLPFKRLAAPIYENIFEGTEKIQAALQSRTSELVAEGYNAQIQFAGNETHLFFHGPERRAILKDSNGYILRGREEHLSFANMKVLLSREPERFSPGVALRPVVQDYLLPVLAYVPGPGELNYWAQLGKVFHVMKRRMPVLYPRLSVLVLTARWQKVLEQENLTIEQVYEGLSDYRKQRIKEQDPLQIDERFDRFREQMKRAYQEVEPLEAINPHIPEWLTQNRDKIEGQIIYLQNKVWQAQRKNMDGFLRRLDQLEDGIFPRQEHQERVLNPLNFVARYGLEFVRQVMELPLMPSFIEQVLCIPALNNITRQDRVNTIPETGSAEQGNQTLR